MEESPAQMAIEESVEEKSFEQRDALLAQIQAFVAAIREGT